jgi:hypothetical protein
MDAIDVVSISALPVTSLYWCGVGDAGPNNEALLTYQDGVQHDPENEELKKGLRRAMDTGVFGLAMVGRCRFNTSHPR